MTNIQEYLLEAGACKMEASKWSKQYQGKKRKTFSLLNRCSRRIGRLILNPRVCWVAITVTGSWMVISQGGKVDAAWREEQGRGRRRRKQTSNIYKTKQEARIRSVHDLSSVQTAWIATPAWSMWARAPAVIAKLWWESEGRRVGSRFNNTSLDLLRYW